jgi:hypothetical protein
MDIIGKILRDARIDKAFRLGIAMATGRSLKSVALTDAPLKGPAMKVYSGRRDKGGVPIVRVMKDGDAHALRQRHDIVQHAVGFDWGTLGEASAQLSLAILADALGDDRKALQLYWGFNWNVVAKLKPNEPWRLTETEVRRAVTDILSNSWPHP